MPPVAAPVRSSAPPGSAARIAGTARRSLAALPEQAAYLVPLRVFIGLGWLRAAAEKLVDPGWGDGRALRAFLAEQAQLGWTLPFYEPVLAVSDRVAVPLGIGLMALEVIIGGAILMGARTTVALMIAITLNFSFIFAGQTNPSVFYILAQLVLLAGGAGALLGVDGLVARTRALRGTRDTDGRRGARRLRLLVATAVLAALCLVPFARTSAPATVIHDPALVSGLLLLLVAGGAGLRLVRQEGSQAPG